MLDTPRPMAAALMPTAPVSPVSIQPPRVGNCLLLAAGKGMEMGSEGHTLLWAGQIWREGGGTWLGGWGWQELLEFLLL